MENIQNELARLKQEIRDLKTAQTTPGTSTLYVGIATLPAGTYKGAYTWTINYISDGQIETPITTMQHGSGFCLLPYNPSTNKQKLEMMVDDLTTVQDSIYVYSTKPIVSINGFGKASDLDPYIPPTPELWEQVRTFKLSQMGTTPGYCLMNCRLGFGIQTGTYANAISDMQAQRNNGTLHGAQSTPPNYLQVPVYIDTGSPDGHVVVWDKGTVYSDGVLISNGLNYYGLSNVWGWGELCDGARVVKKTS